MFKKKNSFKKQMKYSVFILIFSIAFLMNATILFATSVKTPLYVTIDGTGTKESIGGLIFGGWYGVEFLHIGPNHGASKISCYHSIDFFCTKIDNSNLVNTLKLDYNLATFSVPLTAPSYACSSDLRWKKSVTPIESALQKVLGLRGVNYFWKVDEYKDKGFTREKQIGFIAQEVEKVMPELVHTGKDGYKTMSYDRVTALLVEAVKELKKQSDTKIASLEKENAQLKNRLASLEKLEQRMAALEKVNSRGTVIGMK